MARVLSADVPTWLVGPLRGHPPALPKMQVVQVERAANSREYNAKIHRGYKKLKEKLTLGFEFEEVPLQEAQNVVTAGSGKYSALVVILSKKLMELDIKQASLPPSERKTFAFGLPGNKELEEKSRDSLAGTVTKTLVKLGLAWKIRYSPSMKQFVCVPVVGPAVKAKATGRRVASSEESARRREEIMKLLAKGVRPIDIATQLGLSKHVVNYHIYDKENNRSSK